MMKNPIFYLENGGKLTYTQVNTVPGDSQKHYKKSWDLLFHLGKEKCRRRGEWMSRVNKCHWLRQQEANGTSLIPTSGKETSSSLKQRIKLYSFALMSMNFTNHQRLQHKELCHLQCFINPSKLYLYKFCHVL